ncbi:MAG: type VI secretion system baseplate subunit TssE [Thermodesulfobacteriota bacterium]
MRKTPTDVRAPLLDRLVDEDPRRASETVPKRALTRRQYRESVRRDLVWLLNTRAPIPSRFARGEELTVLDFGIPDFGDIFTANRRDWSRLARAVERALAAFEPRLANPAVEVAEQPGDIRRLDVVIRATLLAERDREPFSFPLVYDLEREAFTGLPDA